MTNKELKQELMGMSFGELKGRYSEVLRVYNNYKESIKEKATEISNLAFDHDYYGEKMTRLISDLNNYKSDIKYYENWLKIATPIYNQKEAEGIDQSEYERYMGENKVNIQRLVLEVNKLKEEVISNNRDEKITTKMIEESIEIMLKELVFILKDRIGNIEEISRLDLNNGRGFDGIFKGEKGTINIDTVLCGGYNIQRLHWRTLVYRY